MTYWQRQQPPDSRDLDSVPITLVRRQGRYFVGGIVERREASATDAPATGISVGDELISVDGVKAPGATKEAILSALHGSPGDVRRLILQRNGSRIAVSAAVSSFE